MKIKYFEDTDTVLLEIGEGTPAETRELSEDVYLDLDETGHVVSHHGGKRESAKRPLGDDIPENQQIQKRGSRSGVVAS